MNNDCNSSLNSLSVENNLNASFVASYPKKNTYYGLTIIANPFTTLYNKIREFAQSHLADLIFYASGKKYKKNLDAQRLEDSREFMKKIGAVNYIIQTPDGKKIDAIHLSSKKFKDFIVQNGGQFKTKQSSDGKFISKIKVYNPALLNLLDEFRFPSHIPVKSKSNYFEGKFHSNIEMYNLENVPHPIDSIDDNEPGICIIGQGNAGIYEKDRRKIMQTLLLGSDVIVANIRGTGRSEGIPNENGTYLDYESVYQFISKELNYPDHKITGMGYCLSAGPITELASNHPIHLDIDRSFSRIGDVMGETALDHVSPYVENIGWISKIFNKFFPPLVSLVSNKLIISYDNSAKISKVRGSIFLVDATHDDVIPRSSSMELKEKVQKSSSLTSYVSFEGGHCDELDRKTFTEYQNFLVKRKTLRNYGNTPLPSYEKQMEWLDLNQKIVSKSIASTKSIMHSNSSKTSSC